MHHFAVRITVHNTGGVYWTVSPSLGPLLRRDFCLWVCDPASTIPDSLDDSTETTRLRQRVLHQIVNSVAIQYAFVNL